MQKAKPIDVTRSFAVTDPNAFPENQAYTVQEDYPEKLPPILGFEGYNFLPTSYGYRSFFGQNSTLDVLPYSGSADKVISFQFANYKNILVALGKDGISWIDPSVSGAAWKTLVDWAGADWLGGRGMIQLDDAQEIDFQRRKAVEAATPTPYVYKEWTYCIIANVLYMYREGENKVYTISHTGIDLVTGDITIGNFVPSFLNMTAQKGIFAANGRLGFWDSANSVAWGNPDLMSDFTPSVETRVGSAIFNGVRGRIVTILAQGDGFVIYTTKGIVGVRFNNDTNLIWDASVITETAGISYEKAVCAGITDLEHYAYTNTGIKKIGAFSLVNKSHQFEEILTDVFDYLKESRDPVYLRFMAGRFLILNILDPTYIDGTALYSYDTSGEVIVSFPGTGGSPADLIPGKKIFGIDPQFFFRAMMVYSPGDPAVGPTPGSPGAPDILGSIGYPNDGPHPVTLVVNDGTPATPWVEAGWTTGIFWWWTGSPRVMYVRDGRTTAIFPWNADDFSYHIPNTSISLANTFVNNLAGVQNAADLRSVSEASPDNAQPPTSSIEGALNFPGLNNVTFGVHCNTTDISLNEMVATQLIEWNNLSDIQTANKAAVYAIPDKTYPTVLGTDPFELQASATAYIPTLQAQFALAHPGAVTGSGTSYYDEFIGSIIDGDGVVSNGVIENAKTGFATYSVSKTFTGGVDIVKRTTRTWTVRAGATLVKATMPWNVESDYDTGWPTDITRRVKPGVVDGVIPPPKTLVTIGWGTTNAEAFADMAYPPEVMGWLGSAVIVSAVHDGGFGPYQYAASDMYPDPGNIYKILGTFHYIDLAGPNSYTQPAVNILTRNGIAVYVSATPYYIDYVDVVSIESITNPTMEVVSTFTAAATVLEWGWNLNEPPKPGSYPMTIPKRFNNVGYPSYSITPGHPGVLGFPGYPGTPGSYSYTWLTDVVINQWNFEIPPIAAPAFPGIPGGGTIYPGVKFLIDSGTTAPLYPTFVGGLVFDTFLKKVGKFKASYQELLDIIPVNATGVSLNHTNFGFDMAMLDSSGVLTIFDAAPVDSWIRYGKIGYGRHALTQAQEARFHFRTSSTGNMTLSTSLDGKVVDLSTVATTPFVNASEVTGYFSNIGAWHTLTISGKFDLQYMEFRGNYAGRR